MDEEKEPTLLSSLSKQQSYFDFLVDKGKRELDDINIGIYKFDENEKRDHIVREILTTELAYVESLRILNAVYMTPLQNSVESGDPILTREECGKLFRDVKPVFEMHTSLVTELAAKLENWPEWQLVGKLFMDYAPFFKMYSQYSQNHENVNDLITVYQQKHRKFAEFCASVRRNTDIKTIESYLIMPIQRLPRYILLFEQLLKICAETHEDYVNLDSALKMINSSAQHVNESVSQFQNMERMIGIQNDFLDNPELVIPSRIFIHEGPLTVRRQKSDVTFQAFLFNDIFLLASQVIMKYKVYQKIPLDSSFYVDSFQQTQNVRRTKMSRVKSSIQKTVVLRSRSQPPFKRRNSRHTIHRTRSISSTDSSRPKKHLRKWSTGMAVKQYSFVVWNSVESFTALCDSKDERESWMSILEITAQKANEKHVKSPRRKMFKKRVADLRGNCTICELWGSVNSCSRCFSMVCSHCSDMEQKFARGPVRTRLCHQCTHGKTKPKEKKSRKFFHRSPSLPRISRYKST